MLRRGGAAEQAFGTEVFVQVRPMNAISAAGYFPLLALVFGRMQQLGIPSERDGDSAAVHQGDTERVRRKRNIHNSFVSSQRQNTHSIPLKAGADAARLTIVPYGVRLR